MAHFSFCSSRRSDCECRVLPRCWRSANRVLLRSMRRTASPLGDMISGAITGLLGQHLPALRPAPVIALTATATPLVQDDIVRQLAYEFAAARFIHGFRRENLAIEVVETPKPQRAELTRENAALPIRSGDPRSCMRHHARKRNRSQPSLSPLFPYSCLSCRPRWATSRSGAAGVHFR